MSNGTCPVCGERTQGKAVRGINFCPDHRAIAITVRDDPELQKQYRDNPPKGERFTRLVLAAIDATNKELAEDGLRIVGTQTIPETLNSLEE